MKYRRLRLDELEEVEEKFVQFLAANGIASEDWQKMKDTQKDKADEMIDIFSDFVFESVLEKVEYLEHKLQKEVRYFECGEETIRMIGIKVSDEVDIDFRKNQSPGEMMQQVKSSHEAVKLFAGQKSYKVERKQELFRMMESGCLISDGTTFKMLDGLRQ